LKDNEVVRQESERSCIVSREAQPKDGLLRFVVSPDGVLIPDVAEKLPGRGLWLSCSVHMLHHALEQHAFNKAARQKLVIPDGLDSLIEKQLLQRVQHWLSLAVKAGEVVSGFVKVEAWLASRRVVLLLEASDGASDGKEKIKRLASGVLCKQILTRDELGDALGKADAVHVAVASGGIAEYLLRDLRRLAGFRKKDGL
jgi:uncharacterized protein